MSEHLFEIYRSMALPVLENELTRINETMESLEYRRKIIMQAIAGKAVSDGVVLQATTE